MKTLTITVFALLSFVKYYSQDLLTMKSGTSYEVKILEIRDYDIRFKMHSNLDGPTYSISRNSFSTIRYQNGTTELLALEDNTNQHALVINGYNTSTDGGITTYSFSNSISNSSPPPPAPTPTKVTAGDVIGAILFTGLFALKVAADMDSQKCSRNHTHSNSCCSR